MSKRSSRLLHEDILEAKDRITRYALGMSYDNFVNDSKTFDAVIRNFEIIGEAASLLPKDIEGRYPEIEWHRAKKSSHFGVDPSIVRQIIQDDLQSFRIAINKILNETSGIIS